MADESLARVVRLYEQRGTLESIEGDVARSARDWLDRAVGDLEGVGVLLEAERWRLAYKAGYDVLRNAAEAIITRAGYRVRGGEGSHEAVFVVANELVGARSDVFNAADMAQARQRRNASQYIDVDRPSEVNDDDARRVVGWATAAIAVARDYVG
jgi:HEPN domain-containing protein